MIFKIEIDIDWIDEDSTLESELKEQLIKKLSQQILTSFNKEAGIMMAKEAEALIKAKTDLLINTMLEKPVVVSNGWNSKKEYPSIYDMVEKKMTALYEGKLGASDKCEKDPLLGKIETFVTRETETLLSKIEKRIKEMATEESKKAVNQNELIKAIGMRIK